MYTDCLKYQNLLIDMQYSNHNLKTFVDECCLINESKHSFENLCAINEGLLDTAKNLIKKITDAILRIWNKFIQATNSFLKSDKDYLDRYKDIILKKKPIECTYTMYNYPKGIPMLIRYNVPNLDVVNMTELDDKGNFIDKYFKEFVNGGKSPYDNFVDLVKNTFRGGGEIQVDSSQLNMTDLFNYCYTYDKIKENIEKDINTVRTVSNKSISDINGMIQRKEIDSGEENNNQEQNNNNNQQQQSTNNNNQNNNPKPNNESYVFYEDGEGAKRDLNTGKSDSGKAEIEHNANPNKAYRSVDKNQMEKNRQELNHDNVNKAKMNGKQAINRAQLYLKVCGDFISAKQTCAENAYKNYMSIIKAHVNDYVSDKSGNDRSQSQQSGTDYNNVNPDQEQPKDNEQNNK